MLIQDYKVFQRKAFAFAVSFINLIYATSFKISALLFLSEFIHDKTGNNLESQTSRLNFKYYRMA